MDHKYIEEHNIADRYLIGKLSPGEQDEFELHYISCKKCVKLLEEVQIVRRTLRFAEPALPVESDVRLRTWLGSLIRSFTPLQQAALMGILFLLLATFPLIFLATENRRLQRDLDQTRASRDSLTAELQNQDNINRADQAAGAIIGTTEANQEGADQIKSKRTLDPNPSQQVESWPVQPQPNTPIFILSGAKRSRDESAVLPDELRIEPSTRFFVISLELGGAPKFERYQARIITGSNQTHWQTGNLRPNSYGTLTISFNSNYFQEGDYLLTLEGLSREGEFLSVANYPFRVIKKNPKK